MTSGLTRDQFRAYAYALWSRQLAIDAETHYASWKDRPSPGDDRDIYHGERLVVQKILRKTLTDKTSTTGQVGYLPAEEAIVVDRDTCEEVTGLTGNSARTYFAKNKTLAARYSQASLRRDAIKAAELLSIDRDFLRLQLDVRTDEIPYHGQVVVKNAGGLTWIKLLRQQTPASPWITEVALDVSASVVFEWLPSETAACWQHLDSSARNLTRLDDDAFRACCEELLDNLYREHSGIPVPSTIDAAGLARPENFTIVNVCAPAITSDTLLDALRPHFTKGTPKHAVLIVMYTRSDHGIDLAIAQAMRHVGGIDVFIAAAALPQLQAQLSRYPWLWSKYLGEDESLLVIECNDAQRLDAAFCADGTIALHEQPVNPVLDSVKADARHIAITGQPGTGKSTAIAQLLQRRPESVALIARSARADDQTLLTRVLDATSVRARTPIIVIDNLHDWPETDAVRVLEEITTRCIRGTLGVILSFWTSERSRMQATYGYLLRRVGLIELNLDDAGAPFLLSIADAYARAWNSTLRLTIRRKLVRNIQRQDNRIHTLLSALRRLAAGRGFVVSVERGTYWPARAEELITAGGLLPMTVLRIVALLRILTLECSVERIVSFTARYLTDTGLAVGRTRVNDTLLYLDRNGWLRRTDPYVRTHDIQLKAITIGVLSPWLEFLNEFTTWLADIAVRERSSDDIRVLQHFFENEVELSIWEEHLGDPDKRRAEQLWSSVKRRTLRALIALDVDSKQLFIEATVLSARGELPEGEVYLQRYLERHPDPTIDEEACMWTLMLGTIKERYAAALDRLVDQHHMEPLTVLLSAIEGPLLDRGVVNVATRSSLVQWWLEQRYDKRSALILLQTARSNVPNQSPTNVTVAIIDGLTRSIDDASTG